MLTHPQSCKPSDLDQTIKLIDDIFIKSRKKRISCFKRFPTLFNQTNFCNLRIIKGNNEVISHVGIKYCHYRLNKKKTKIGMIGCVCTNPSYRGFELASLLMRDAEKQMSEKGTVLGVLWTGIPSFYKKLGWVPYENGVLGKMSKKQKITNKSYTICKIASSELKHLNNLRIKGKNDYIIRKSIDLLSILKNTIPSSVEDRGILCAKSISKLEAYIAFGNLNKNFYIYEIGGGNDAVPLLIDSIFSLCKPKRIFWNCKKDDPMISYLKKYFNITFTEKGLTMWKIFDQKYKKELSNIYIPFLDRI